MPDPAEPKIVRLPGGGVGLQVDRLIVPGATAGQVLIAVSDGAGGYVFAPGAAGGSSDSGPVANDLSTGTATNGAGSASVAASAAVLSYTDAQSGAYAPGSWTGPRVKLARVVPFATGARVYCRIASLVGDNTTILRVGLLSETADRFLGFWIRASDGAGAGYTSGGAAYNTPSPLVLDGADWILFERQAGTVSWSFGRGTTTAPPVDWTHVGSLANTDAGDTTLGFGLAKGSNGLVGSASVDHVHVQAL